MDELDGNPHTQDEEAETMTASEVLVKLEEAWMNEKFSPELLEIKSDLVDCMLEQVKEMEENIQRAKKNDFRVFIHKMEIDRIRYVISSYLRTRLKKIEQYTSYILDKEAERSESDIPHLSPEEYAFAKEYLENIESHFKVLGLRHMPPNLQTIDSKQTAIKPNLNSYVFLKVLEDTEGVIVEEETADTGEEVMNLVKGDQHVIRYRPVASLVQSGAICLI
ncbi:DNA replication complex GINS protein SLD5-like [Tubulanus polymorphus]|uniref:DNA replication complex GINS protein SLD5-like n=1 Tax=Tubulanus polymorphus TaxID=672921 RepID=UPI003DA1E262